jgi:HNH endonuclease
VRWEGVDRKWPGTPPSRNGWKTRRVSALRGTCEVVSCGVTFTKAGPRRHVDHIVPARLIRRLRAGNPDRRENLECICGTCHGYKLQADHKLCLGDRLGYMEILRGHNFDLARIPKTIRRSFAELCLGEDHHKIAKWIQSGWLQDRLQGTRRHGGNGNDIHRIREDDVVEFIRNHPQEINLGKVDQTWFFDLVLLKGRAVRQGLSE